MNNSLVPFCPALPKLLMPGDLHPVTRTTLAPTALKLLENNQSIVITGPSHGLWERNKQIGKTFAVKNRLIARLRRQGLTVSYFNIQHRIYNSNRPKPLDYDYSRLPAAVSAFKYKDVMVLDEIHHVTPSEAELKFRRGHRLACKGPILKLWRKVERNIAQGGKVVFISCYHPLDHEYDDCVLNSAMALFFASPVLELR